jgi:hypothetical protein
VVQRRTDNGLEDAVHDIIFAFAFNAYYSDSASHTAPES